METKQKRPPAKSKSKPAETKKAPRRAAAKNNPPAKAPKKTAAPKRKQSPKKPSADVVYVQPAPFNRTRFVLCMLIVVAVVLAVIFGMSIFFKVDADKIVVSGTDKYSAWQIAEASGIHDGENLFSINEPRISNNVMAKLPYVKKVRVGIKLPDTVMIEIEEYTVVYAMEATDATWWLVRSDGVAVEKTNAADAELHTKILGFKIENPAEGEFVKAFQPVAEETGEGEDIPITVLASEQCSTALQIAQYLEDVGIIGGAKSIDTTDLGDIQLWYGEQYKVLFGDASELPLKIKSMNGVIKERGSNGSGVMDVSFTVLPNEVICTPFS